MELYFLRSVETGATGKGVSRSPVTRRSPRVAIDMPVEVSGQGVNGKVFQQETRTTIVNAHGAHLIIEMTTEIETSLLLKNRKTGVEVQCRVACQKTIESGRVELGIEFVEPKPRFWGIAFPPEDWSRAERKMPASHSR